MIEIDKKSEVFEVYKCACSGCKHNFDITDFTCDAFKTGIPNDILAGKNKHDKPEEDQDNNLTYSPR